eukprot:CAMPEP_0116928058 /NCGR_PEP_ID=MMETSP0467-20121206/25746_1 /TAXON_ID=283647 /ORGANISM="Mesodinium pulex, Strain SPMC105" /LENGTH=37 /DNA_ID= /DNA_START= /DNA_END= /DNA_ORIENTATION=
MVNTPVLSFMSKMLRRSKDMKSWMTLVPEDWAVEPGS